MKAPVPTFVLVGYGEPLQAAIGAQLAKRSVHVEIVGTESAISAIQAAAADFVVLMGDAAAGHAALTPKLQGYAVEILRPESLRNVDNGIRFVERGTADEIANSLILRSRGLADPPRPTTGSTITGIPSPLGLKKTSTLTGGSAPTVNSLKKPSTLPGVSGGPTSSYAAPRPKAKSSSPSLPPAGSAPNTPRPSQPALQTTPRPSQPALQTTPRPSQPALQTAPRPSQPALQTAPRPSQPSPPPGAPKSATAATQPANPSTPVIEAALPSAIWETISTEESIPSSGSQDLPPISDNLEHPSGVRGVPVWEEASEAAFNPGAVGRAFAATQPPDDTDVDEPNKKKTWLAVAAVAVVATIGVVVWQFWPGASTVQPASQTAAPPEVLETTPTVNEAEPAEGAAAAEVVDVTEPADLATETPDDTADETSPESLDEGEEDPTPAAGSAEAEEEPTPAAGPSIQYLLRTANFQRGRGRLQLAKRNYDAILSRAPRNGPALAGMARIALQERHATQALTLARRLASVSPESAGTQVLLGEALAASGDRAGARRAWQAALAINPRHSRATALLAQ